MASYSKKAVMKLARSRFGGALASFGIRRCLGLLPVAVLARDKNCVMLRHPQPMAPRHSIIVPRKRFAHIGKLLENEADWAAFAAFVGENVPFQEMSLCCNFGCRQDVKQVHFHVLPKASLALGEGEEADWLELEGRWAGFGRRGNAYMSAGDMPAREYVKKVFAEAARRHPEGFSLIWR